MCYKKFSRSVSVITVILLLLLISVITSLMIYVWIGGFTGSATSSSETGAQVLGEKFKIEAYRVVETDEGILLLIWVRNLGDTIVKVNSVYYGSGESFSLASLAYSNLSPPIWGGDEYEFDGDEQIIVLKDSGVIFYEDFRDGYDSSKWITISTLESSQGEEGSIIVDSQHGLILKISRPGTSGTEKYGLRLKDPLSIPSGRFIVEVATGKMNGTQPYNYLVEVYFSQYATTGNPHFLSQFVAVYINGWYPPSSILSTAIMENRDKDGVEWDYEIEDYQTYGRWLLRFLRNEDRIYVYYNGTYQNYLTNFDNEMYTNPYIYLDIGLWSGQSGTFCVYIPYIKVYRSLDITIKGLRSGWRVLIVDDEGRVLGDKTSSGEEVSFSKDELNCDYPRSAHIIIIPPMEDSMEIGYIIEPRETRIVAAFITSSLPTHFKVKVVSERGVEATTDITGK